MQKPKILVTGATGKTGAPSALLLLQKGYAVRALVHREDARSASLQQAGAEIFVGSLEDPVDVREAMKGVQRAYFCPPLEPGSLRRAAIFAEAAQDARLEAIVVLKPMAGRPHPFVHSCPREIPRGKDVPLGIGRRRDHDQSRLVRRQLHGGSGADFAIRADGAAAWEAA